MKFTTALCIVLAVDVNARHHAAGEHKLRRKIQQQHHKKPARRMFANEMAEGKKAKKEKKSNDPDYFEEGVGWEPGSFTFGTYIRE